ncbi:MAG: M23 family metallopeptidase [Spirochaetaceae bacterium]|nr:M23 family metallopeptidase [Spirochaetaceae bacterium]
MARGGRGAGNKPAAEKAGVATEAAALAREVAAEAARLRRAAGSKEGPAGRWPFRRRLGRRLLACLLASALLLIALPPFLWPIRGRVTSPWFFRHKPDSANPLALEFHDGIDIAAPAGTPVLATAPGRVVETGFTAAAGNYVRVRHLLGLESYYCHLSAIDAVRGRLVLVPGLAPLGRVGSTGRSTGPHLHFEIQADGRSLPPRALLAPHDLRRALIGF